MLEPGLDRHGWESELAVLEDGLRDDPAAALPELEDLVRRMLEETGYDVAAPVVREGEDREIVAEYVAAHEVAAAVERGVDDLSPGDVASAVDGFRAVFDHLVATRREAEPDADVE